MENTTPNTNSNDLSVKNLETTKTNNTTPSPTPSKQKNNGKLGLKLIIILVLSLLLLIPQTIIMNLVDERSQTELSANLEVSEKWGTDRTLVGPVIFIPGDSAKNNIYILSEELNIEGDISTQTLKRGIYDFSVYEVPIKMSGHFVLPKELNETQISHLQLNRARILFAINDFKGFSDNPTLTYQGQPLSLSAEQYKLGDYNALTCPVDVTAIFAQGKASYELNVPLKGSNSIAFLPVGRTTSAHISSDCKTPSFGGNFLPDEREITDEGFTASWKVLALNRELPQVVSTASDFTIEQYFIEGESDPNGTIKIDLKVPVEQYQQTTRAIKYAYLIILLTFAVVFFVEIRRQTPIHPIQYALVGIALMLFYTLLLSFSEHLTFLFSYIIASVMTIALITLFMRSILKNRKAALAIGGLLTALYLFIYVIMQLESYALLVGSIGIFVILAVAMYASQKINWYQK